MEPAREPVGYSAMKRPGTAIDSAAGATEASTEERPRCAVAGPFRFRNAIVEHTLRGGEVRAVGLRQCRGSLVGIVNAAGQLVIREGAEIFVIVEVQAGKPSPG